MLLTSNVVFWFRFQKDYTTNIGNPELQGTLTYTSVMGYTGSSHPTIVTTHLGRCLKLNLSSVKYNRPPYFDNYQRAINGAKSVVTRFVKDADDYDGQYFGGLIYEEPVHRSFLAFYFFLGRITTLPLRISDIVGNYNFVKTALITTPPDGTLETISISHPKNYVSQNLLPKIVYCCKELSVVTDFSNPPINYISQSHFYFGTAYNDTFFGRAPRKYMKDIVYFDNELDVPDLKRVSLGLHPLKRR